MDAEDFCISTPKPSRFHQNSSAASASRLHQQQSGKKRRAPCRRLKLSSKDKDSTGKECTQNEDDDEGSPAAKRLKHSPPSTFASTNESNQQISMSKVFRCDTLGSALGAAMVKTPPRQSSRISSVIEKDELERNGSDQTRFITPPRRRSTIVSASRTPSRFNSRRAESQTSICETSPLPQASKFELSGGPFMFHDPYKTPPRTNHRSNYLVNSELNNESPHRIAARTPERTSSVISRHSSPSTPAAPFRGRRGGRQSLMHALLSGNLQQVEAALISGADPNDEISIPLENDNETTMGETIVKQYVTRQNMLPLLAAAKLNSSASIIESLVNHGAVPNSVNSKGQTALHIICKQKLNKRQTLCSKIVSETPNSCRSSQSASSPIPPSWLKLQQYFESLSPEIGPDSPVKVLRSVNPNKTRLGTCFSNDVDYENDENFATPRSLVSSIRIDKEVTSYQSSSTQESELVLSVNVLLKYGIDRSRRDVNGLTAADYAQLNGLLTLYEILQLSRNESNPSTFHHIVNVQCPSSPHHRRDSIGGKIQRLSRKEPPDRRREKKPPPLLPLASLSTQNIRSNHKAPPEQQLQYLCNKDTRPIIPLSLNSPVNSR